MQNKVKKFIQYVLTHENMEGWRVVFGVPPSECICDLKLIRLSNELNGSYMGEMFLHEVAHAGDIKHGESFYKKLGELYVKYAGHIPVIVT